MFAAIKTNGATHIVIHIPHEGSDRSLPALARMLEENAVFVRVGYQDMGVVKPEMGITLGSTYTIEHSEETLAVKESNAVLDDEFVNATPEAFVSNAAARKRATEEQSRLRTELQFTKDELARLRSQLEALTNAESA